MSVITKLFLAGTICFSLANMDRAVAQLTAFGPVSPDNGFPTWYRDGAGTQLDLCLSNPALCALLAPVQLAHPNQPFPQNYGGTFPDESFYSLVEAAMPTNAGGQALLIIALEAGFVNGAVAAGDQMVFARIRVRVDNLVAGQSYRITTPYGTNDQVATGAGSRGINFTQDVGLTAGAFGLALNGGIGPFLRWDSGLPLVDALGDSFFGDPAVDHAITGSPTGDNLFRISGPNVGGPGVNAVSTNLFTLVGKQSRAVPPVAALAAAPTSGVAPLTVAFQDQSLGTVTSRAWDFGDGSGSAAANPSHVYSAPGTFTVSLTVSGPGGTDTATMPGLITVVSPAQVPVADFSATPQSGQAPLSVAFTNLSTGTITSRAWNFGDGGSSTVASPTHVYTHGGTFTVSLTVTGPGGTDTRTVAGLITVTVPSLVLHAATPGRAPGRNVFTADGVTPGGDIFLLWSHSAGAGPAPVRGCTLVTGLESPLVLAHGRARGATTSWSVNLRRAMAGQTLRLQAVDAANCNGSNVITQTF